VKYILAIVLVLFIATVFFIVRPRPNYVAGKAESVPAATAPFEEKSAQELERQAEANRRRAAMQAEFDQLARARRDLNQKLDKLKVVLWDVKLPKAENDAITETMKNSYAMLKNKRLLGAYSSIDEISTEVDRVKFLYSQLQAVEDKYRDKGTEK
jgi:hypothetical protein